jgi:hypothetical protein
MTRPPPEILPPTNVSSKPDAATKTGLVDFTGPSAPKRVLYVNLGILRYGTNDKVHAAALILSFVLLMALFGVVITGFYLKETGWAERAFTWLGNAFLFIAGVAVGKGTGPDKDSDDVDP